MSDAAARFVAALFALICDICRMYLDDMIARAAVGDLTRSVNKVVQNPFKGWQDLLKLAHVTAVHFSYSTRFDKMLKMTYLIVGGAPSIRLKVCDYLTAICH